MPDLASDIFGMVARLVDETAAALRGLGGAPPAFAFTELSGCVAAVALAATAAAGGPIAREDAPAPAMVSKAIGTMVAARPGCYLWLGVGMARVGLHADRFDFTDRLLLTAPACLAALIRRARAEGGGA